MQNILAKSSKSFIFSVILGLLLLVGCTSPAAEVDSTPTSETAPTRKPTVTITPYPEATFQPEPTQIPYLMVDLEDLAGVTIQFWHPYTNDTADRLREMTQTFNEENDYGVRVEVFSMGAASALDQRMVEQAQTGEPLPDIAAAPALLSHQWNDAGWLIPVEDYLMHADWGWDETILDQFDAFSLEQSQTDGIQTALPLVRNASVLVYNETWAKELGFSSAPTTLRALREQACTAQQSLLDDDDPENDGTGGWILNNDEATLLSWLAAFGEDEFLTLSGDYSFETDESLEAFNFLWQMNADGCAWTSRDPLPYDYFSTRRALIYSASTRDTLWQERSALQADSTDDWTLLPYPAESGAPVLLWDVSALTILESSPEEQLASWLFMDWLLGEKNQALLSISTNSYPVREDAWRWMEISLRNHPEWAAVREMNADGIANPQHPNWEIVGDLLEDAAWQLYQPYTIAEDVPTILEQLDAMIVELTE